MKLNLQTFGLQTQSKWSVVIIGEKYVERLYEVMEIVNRIHEDTGLPIVIFIHVKSSPIICSKSPLLAERL